MRLARLSRYINRRVVDVAARLLNHRASRQLIWRIAWSVATTPEKRCWDRVQALDIVCGNPTHNGTRRHILAHHRARGDHRLLADRDVWQEDRARANPRIGANRHIA